MSERELAPVRLETRTPSDAVVARSVALRFALDRGASRLRAGELAIIAGELASNLVRHAGGGVLLLEQSEGAIRVRSLDRGASGITPDALLAHLGEVPRLVEESGTMRKGLGCGLGAVRRLSDEVHVRRLADGWLEICATRRL